MSNYIIPPLKLPSITIASRLMQSKAKALTYNSLESSSDPGPHCLSELISYQSHPSLTLV